MRYYIRTYGCTLNQADSEIMNNLLLENGFELADSEENADVIVVNTCTVKAPTEEKILNYIKCLHNDGKQIIASGCLATVSPEKILKYAPNAGIISTTNIDKIIEAASEIKNKSPIFNKQQRIDKLFYINKKFSFQNPLIAKIPINEGCLGFCTFCETKFARGALNSFSEELILNAIDMSVKKGAVEIQLTSQDTGAYGVDKKTDIIKLMKKIKALDSFKSINQSQNKNKNQECMIRIGMMNPEHMFDIVDEFLELIDDKPFYKFVHLPLQSGSNKVLKDMHREYTNDNFIQLVKKIRNRIPSITLETDIIVGFPTESDEDFNETLKLVKEIKADIVNMSKFWKREHAPAAKLKQLPNEVIAERSIELARVVRKIQKEINETFIGKVIEATITEEDKYSFAARSESYKKIIIKKTDDNAENLKLGMNLNIKIKSATANVLYGKASK
ncbi:MAG: tRNA (N(6)-L-threonylcarbamoyladenosine(37)-C(2))-methylthiotransferase [Candidatus Marsarchaeota archaeon]|nr:tRNA (N(6)-L-threonylcarbamoyladenosine(37)-C(2))-methylthiotransferase [Candidatus Marsarchaeota archaeon]